MEPPYVSARRKHLRNLKRKTTVAAFVVGAIGLAGCAGATYGIYRAVAAAAGAVERTLAHAEAPSIGGFEGMAVGFVDDWMAQTLRKGDTVALKNGLSCLAALGGPSPERTLEALAARAGESATGREAKRVLGELQDASRTPTPGDSLRPDKGACLRIVMS